MDDTRDYRRAEIAPLFEELHTNTFKIKITGDFAQTKWLNITAEELRAIANLLAGKE